VNILEMDDTSFGVNGGKIYRHNKWKRERRPGIGVCTVRELVVVNENNRIQAALRGWPVEVFKTIQEAERHISKAEGEGETKPDFPNQDEGGIPHYPINPPFEAGV
jgi:hypothetical protein